LAPIIVQAGLMAANDILCVENPEVHLHPKLQLDIAEFFVMQASIGKYMILETHSDLVVRRVMRAVLSEELTQEAVRLYFARIHSESKHIGNRLEWINRETSEIWPFAVAYSVLEPVEIDERGRIRNWPDGFLDADILESRRLIDVMYGNPPDDRDADDNEEVRS
jgi:predicted ATPase